MLHGYPSSPSQRCARWRCYNRGGHGTVALVKALQYSCDTYFYSLGYEMGPDKHAETGKLMGFGSRTGIGIDREIPGIMPDGNYYRRTRGYLAPGFVVNNSIGQGDVAVTPLQLAMAYSAIANGGHVYRPQLVREVVDAGGETVVQNEPVVRYERHPVRRRSVRVIQRLELDDLALVALQPVLLSGEHHRPFVVDSLVVRPRGRPA